MTIDAITCATATAAISSVITPNATRKGARPDPSGSLGRIDESTPNSSTNVPRSDAVVVAMRGDHAIARAGLVGDAAIVLHPHLQHLAAVLGLAVPADQLDVERGVVQVDSDSITEVPATVAEQP